MSGIVSVYCVFGSLEEAQRIGAEMVEARLAACVNILGPCTSIYRWEGQVHRATEVAALFKSAATGAEALVHEIAARHSYAVPAITVWPVDLSLEAYAQWVRAAHEAEG